MAKHTIPYPNPTKDLPSNRNSPIDGASVEGKFGWTQFADKFVPFLLRNEEKYVPVNIMVPEVYHNYIRFFTVELYKCIKVKLYNMTQNEVTLINEINSVHCEGRFDYLKETANNTFFRLEDAGQIHNFLRFCHHKLILKDQDNDGKRCGFIRINKQNCVPYVWYNHRQYAPLFYMDDGDGYKYLEEKSVQLRGWELCYLKLCCKIHGVRNTLFEGSSLAVVDLELLKKVFPRGTVFEYSWPIDTNIKNLLNNLREGDQAKIHMQKRLNSTGWIVSVTKKSSLKQTEEKPQNSDGNYPDYSVENRLEQCKDKNQEIKPIINTVKPVTHPNLSCKLLPIPDFLVPNDAGAYSLFMAPLSNGKTVVCINQFPFDSSTGLVMLEQASQALGVPFVLLVETLSLFGFNIYGPNKEQNQLLAGNGYATLGLLRLDELRASLDDLRIFAIRCLWGKCLRGCIKCLSKR